ncbi:MAG: DNA-directed DNA polymerase II small subunit [Candidatus Woesearchaeota archaeon]|jgi:DNA polymerase II small subunit
MEKSKLIEEMFEKGILVSKEMLGQEVDQRTIGQIQAEGDLLVLNQDYSEILNKQTSLVDWYEIDKMKVAAEKDRDDDLYQNQLQNFRKVNITLNTSTTTQTISQTQEHSSLEVELNSESTSTLFSVQSLPSSNEEQTSAMEISSNLNSTYYNNLNLTFPVTIVVSYENKPHKYEIKDFTNIFLTRYRFLEKILRGRHELIETLTSISRVLIKKEKETVSIIGIVESISETKNGNLMLSIEDPTGKINVLVSKNNPDLLSEAKELVEDEIIGVSGMCGDKIVFIDKIIWPDIPAANEIKKGPDEIYTIFLSDIHVGSKMFLREEFGRFLHWIRGESGNEAQKEAAAKVKYIFIAGDLVDGVGIYPSQEEELEIKGIHEQYVEFCRLISQIPTDKKIIISPGNHDVVHLAEPQPAFYKEYSPQLFDLPNVTLVTNPSIINIAKTDTFEGFDVLMYHGYSFDYYINNVEAIRNNGGYHRADLVMKFLLKRRHLAPSFASTPYFPAHAEDPLLIKKIPDFFVSGHIHYSKVANYKGITMISGSCWQGKTSFQEKMGHEPEPARVPLVNLKTREVKVLKFI